MQKVEEYSRWVIDRAFLYFGEDALSYESVSIHRLQTPIKFTKGQYDTEQERYDNLFQQLSEETLILALHLAVAQYLFPEFYHMLKGLTGQAVTMALALELAGENKKFTLPELKKYYHILKKYLCLEQKMENFLYSELYADERLVLYLAGDDSLPEALQSSCELYFPSRFQNKECHTMAYYEKLLCDEFSFSPNLMKKNLIFQLCAKEGRGRKALLCSVAAKKKAGWIFVSYDRLKADAREELEDFLWLIQREARLYGFGICYYHLDSSLSSKEDRAAFFAYCLKPPLFTPVCICTEEGAELIPYTKLPVRKIIFPPCDSQERILIWQSFAREYQMELDYERYGVKYHLNPEDIEKIFQGLKSLYQSSMTDYQKDRLVAELCGSLNSPPKKGSLHKISSFYTMDDLKLEPEKKKTLENICSYIRCQHQVYYTWNMNTKFSYGKNAAALFYGPPGTGKTMAAHVLSHELKMPLYQIDLSQVVDKYIGETEKRLEEIFAYAQKSNVILFFDEADAIFGKRTEVRETKDRYANTEVSYLLQRMEQYDGVVLLATNFRNNIDEAFMRRMKYVLEFEMPDVQMRKNIWQSGFSKEVPLADIDFDYLAEKVELSGGYIKNIILNAVFLGATEGNKVSMKHILSAVCSEYFKLGRVLKPQDFEKYAYYFYEEEKELPKQMEKRNYI